MLLIVVISQTRVALPAEGVDRNSTWKLNCILRFAVALPAEGVDRNYFGKYQTKVYNGRPPRGGRG